MRFSFFSFRSQDIEPEKEHTPDLINFHILLEQNRSQMEQKKSQ